MHGASHGKARGSSTGWYAHTAKRKGFDLESIIEKLRSMKSDESLVFKGVKIRRSEFGYILKSDKGLMKLGREPTPSSLGLALISLCKEMINGEVS